VDWSSSWKNGFWRQQSYKRPYAFSEISILLLCNVTISSPAESNLILDSYEIDEHGTLAKMHEVITVQLGQQSNYLATHFWNAQASSHRSSQAKDAES